MATILEELKELLEIDTEEAIYNAQLLLYANGGIRYLQNNKVPIKSLETETLPVEWDELKEGDYHIILSWLNLYVLQRFDRTLMTNAHNATMNWINEEMANLLYHLKAVYDRQEVEE